MYHSIFIYFSETSISPKISGDILYIYRIIYVIYNNLRNYVEVIAVQQRFLKLIGPGGGFCFDQVTNSTNEAAKALTNTDIGEERSIKEQLLGQVFF